MKRRDFLRAGVVAAGGTLARGVLATQQIDRSAAATGRPFRLNYAPHFGMFKHLAGRGYLDQIRFAADQGFTAWEDRGMKARPVALQRSIALTMESAGMQMGVFEATTSFRDLLLTRRDKGLWEGVLNDIRESVEVAKRINAKWIMIAPGRYDASCSWIPQRARCVELLKRCCQVIEPHGLVMAIAPPSGCVDRPADQSHEICKAVESPACKMLLGICRRQNTPGDWISTIDRTWPEIGYCHCQDNPAGREHDTGISYFRDVFRHLYSKGFNGVVGMEHGNTQPGRAGDLAAIETYAHVDRF